MRSRAYLPQVTSKMEGVAYVTGGSVLCLLLPRKFAFEQTPLYNAKSLRDNLRIGRPVFDSRQK
jgi:hypothetical protein